MKTLNAHRLDAKTYARQCNDRQVMGVVDTETGRLDHISKGEVAAVARIMLDEHLKEAVRRKLMEEGEADTIRGKYGVE